MRGEGPGEPGRRLGARGALLLVAGLMVLLAGTEAALRAARPDLHDPTYFRAVGRPLERYAEDPELFWTTKTDAGPVAALLAESPEPNRVCIFGGSIADGLAGPLDAVLRERGLAATVLNLAGGGWTTHQALVQQRRFFALRPPTHAVLCNAYNDAQPAVLDDRTQARLNATLARRALFLLNQSRLFTLYRRGLERLRTGDSERPRTVRVPPDQYRANLAAFVARCRADGVVPVLVTQAFPLLEVRAVVDPYNTIQVEVARETGAVLADVRPAIDAEMARLGIPILETDEERFFQVMDRLWSDTIHPNDAGYRVIAGRIVQEVEAAGRWRR